jgi:transposase
VCLDEVGCHRDLTRTYARAPRGQRIVDRVPRNRGRGITVIASLSLAGIGPPMTLDGGTGHADFARYLDAVLLPTLAPGTTIVLDNLSAHRPQTVRARIEAAGCTVRYLPAYSPDLNPIELAFGPLKAGMRDRQVRERSALADAMLEELAAVTPAPAASYFRHCGFTVHAQ